MNKYPQEYSWFIRVDLLEYDNMRLSAMKLLFSLAAIVPLLILNISTGFGKTNDQASITSYIYDDALMNGWQEYVWDTITVNYSNTKPVASGKYSLSITPGRGWTAWHAWSDKAFDTSPYVYLSFVARSSTANTWWEVQFLDEHANKINAKTFLFSPPIDSWQAYTVNLSDHGVAYTKINSIRLWYVTNGVPTSTLYVDDLGFGGTAPAPTPTPTPQTIRYTFTVDANSRVNPFRKQMLGVAHANWEHSWGKYFSGDVPGLAEIYKAANIGLIRYAGGLWSNFVMWERSPQKTPYGQYHANPANYHPDFSKKINTSNEYNFHYGMDEIDSLAKLARSAGADVMIQVNISKNDPYMWADLVHYANIEKKYGFKYWELGNEIDLECQQGNAGACISSDIYKSRVESYVKAMKAVDPTITIVGGVPASAHDIVANNWTDTTSMSRYLTAAQRASVDALSYHWYTDCNLSKLDNIFTWKYDAPDTAWQHMYSRYWSYLGPTRIQQEVIGPANKTTEIGVTELNVDACDMQRAPVNSNHISSLWYADVIGRMAYNGVDFVTWYEGYGNGSQGFPAIFTEEDYYPTSGSIYIRPLFYSMFLYGNFFGDQMVKTTGPDPTDLSLYASLDSSDPDKLFIIVTNLSRDYAKAQIAITGFYPSKGIKYELKNTNPLSLDEGSNGINPGSTINTYRLTAGNISNAVRDIPTKSARIDNGTINEIFSPFTVTALVFNKRQPTKLCTSYPLEHGLCW